MPKGTSWTEVMLNNEKIKPIALAVTGYTISQLLSRSVETPLNKLKKIHSNFLKAFRVDPNQYCSIFI